MNRKNYKLYIKFPIENTYTSYEVLSNSIKLTETVHSGLKNADNYCKLSIAHNQTLEDKLRVITDEGVRTYIEADSERVFTGFIRRAFSFQKDTHVKATSIEIVSPSFMLKRSFDTPIRLVNPAICTNQYSLIHTLFTRSGYTEADLTNLPTISTRIPYFNAEANSSTYYDLINNVLFEYGYIFDFDEYGKPKCYKMNVDGLESSQNFTTGSSGNVYGTMKQNVKMESYQKFKVTWQTLKTYENLTLFHDTTGATGTKDCVIEVPADSYYGEIEAGATGLYCNYENADYEILYAYNASLDVEFSNPAYLKLEEFTDYNTKAFVKIHNTSAALTEYINKFLITGTAICKNADNITKLNNSDGKYSNIKEYEAKYIYATESAENFINNLANYYKYSDFNYTINSYDDFEAGSVVTLQDSNFGTIKCRIIAKNTDCYTGLYTYTVEGVGEYETSSAVTTTEVNGSNQSVTQDKVQTIVNGAVSEALEDLELVDSPNIYADVTTLNFGVNKSSVTPVKQQIETTIHVIQYDDEIDFSFGDFILPEGWSVTSQYHTLTFEVAKNTEIKNGYIEIPVIYRKPLSNYGYIDENENLYADENGNVYGSFVLDDEEKEYKVKLFFIGCTGKYLGPVESEDDIPETTNILIGDYFCFTGATTENYIQCACYVWDGLIWEKDNSVENNSLAMSDVLSVANAALQSNNSTAYQYLDRLVANSAFIDRLVANTAFIDKLVTNDAFINNLVASEAYINKLVSAESFITKLVADDAFVNNIFAQTIRVKTNGKIMSENYSSDAQTGFLINGENGQFECNNGIFRGNIISGPMELTPNATPGTVHYASGDSIYNAYTDLTGKGLAIGAANVVSGTFNGVEITTLYINISNTTTTSDTSKSYGDPYLYQSTSTKRVYRRSLTASYVQTETDTATFSYANTSIYGNRYATKTYSSSGYSERTDVYVPQTGSWITGSWYDVPSAYYPGLPSYSYSGNFTAATNLNVSISSKTLILHDLPTAESDITGVVYRDTFGYLKVTL